MSALAVVAGPADRELDDLDLVAGVRAGDDRAFELLFLRYQPRIAAYVGGMVRDHGRAEDITQEVFMSALRRLREDDQREILFRPWIYEIAKNKCIDHYRRGRHAVEVSFDAHDQVGAAEHGRLAEPGATPDAAVEGKLAFDSLKGAFGGLSAVHHDILVMREFEGLSYREIGERLGLSRPAVESTLFRARKRLGEEYEELVTGQRCVRVQRIVDEQGHRAAGLRDQRRVARHLAHCQPCRRHAHLAGTDLTQVARAGASMGARVAAFLPLPAFLRRRWSGAEEAGHLLGQQAARPAAQWSAQLAGTLDPGTVSTWAKAAATAATVALAGIGGAAVEHRAPVVSSQAGAAAAPAAPSKAARPARPAAARNVATGLPLPAAAEAAAAAARAAAPQTPGGPASSPDAGSPALPPAGAPATLPGATVPAVDPLHPVRESPLAPLEPVVSAPGAIVGSMLGDAGGSAGALDGSGRGADDVAAADAPKRGRLLKGLPGRDRNPTADPAPAPAAEPVAESAAETADGDLPGRGRGILPARRPRADRDLPAQAAPQASAADAPSTGRGDSVRPRVTEHLPITTALRTSLGG